jgi:hypothetical protein
MSTLYPTYRKTSFFTMVGGGVHGEGAGIAHGTIAQAGFTIEASRLFMQEYLQVGGVTTGIIVGEGINGTTTESLTNNLDIIGGVGKRAGIGKSNKPGVSEV